MASVQSFQRRLAVTLAFFVKPLSTSLEFQNTKHGTMVGKGDSRCVIFCCGSKNIIKTGRCLKNRKFGMGLKMYKSHSRNIKKAASPFAKEFAEYYYL